MASAKLRLSPEEIKYINLFETLTGASIKDCIIGGDSVGFLVKSGDMGRAIGKGGVNIDRMRKMLNKNVWVTEFSDDLVEFMRNLFTPTKIRNVRVAETDEGRIVTIEVSRRDSYRVIGVNGSKIKTAKKLAERHFAVDDIKVKSIY